MRSGAVVRAGGWALIIGALAFLAVFSYLAASFDYPDVLHGSAEAVLPRLLATGSPGRAAWALYSVLPLIWLPAGVGAYRAFRPSHPGVMLLALQFAVLAAISMTQGLMRWPSVHWRLAQLYVAATPDQKPVLAAIFDGLNVYLGNYIGEFLGEFGVSVFFLLSSWTMLRSRVSPAWVPYLGLLASVMGLTGMFRNVSAVVVPVAAVNNYLLPIWMIVFGATLVRYRAPMGS